MNRYSALVVIILLAGGVFLSSQKGEPQAFIPEATLATTTETTKAEPTPTTTNKKPAKKPPASMPVAEMPPPVNSVPELPKGPATIDAKSLATWYVWNPVDKVISGSVDGLGVIRASVVIAGKPADDWNTAYKNDQLTVVDGRFAFTIPANKLSCNTYEVTIYNVFATVLASGTFKGEGCTGGI